MFFGINLSDSFSSLYGKKQISTENYISDSLKLIKEVRGIGISSGVSSKPHGNSSNSSGMFYSNLVQTTNFKSSSGKSEILAASSIIDTAALIDMLPKKKGRRPNYIKQLIE
jgi:hypothetical protein